MNQRARERAVAIEVWKFERRRAQELAALARAERPDPPRRPRERPPAERAA